jgi:hypothetical protein
MQKGGQGRTNGQGLRPPLHIGLHSISGSLDQFGRFQPYHPGVLRYTFWFSVAESGFQSEPERNSLTL